MARAKAIRVTNLESGMPMFISVDHVVSLNYDRDAVVIELANRKIRVGADIDALADLIWGDSAYAHPRPDDIKRGYERWYVIDATGLGRDR